MEYADNENSRDKPLTPQTELSINEEQKEVIRGMFRTGNFLVHGTSLGDTATIIQQGRLITAAEKAPDIFHSPDDQLSTEKSQVRGGDIGISFNFNSIEALPGGNTCLWITSPETLLPGTSYKLAPRWFGCVNELQLLLDTFNSKHEYGGFQDVARKKRAEEFRNNLPFADVNKFILVVHEDDLTELQELTGKDRLKLPFTVLTYTGERLASLWWHVDEQARLNANNILATLSNTLNNPQERIEYQELVPFAEYDDMRNLLPVSLEVYSSIRPEGKDGITIGYEDGGMGDYTNQEYEKINWSD